MKYKNLFKIIIIVATFIIGGSPVFSQTSPLNIGTLPAGKSIVIGYDVTVTSGTSVTNQAVISGSNIQALVSNDPKTPAAYDPTVTAIVGALPVTIINVKAYTKITNGQHGVQVEWVTENEISMDKYEVERSASGQQFTKIGSVSARNNNLINTYHLFDAQPLQGDNFYRITSIERSGQVKYSQVVKVNIGKPNPSIVIYPNPVTDGQLTIDFENLAKGNYKLHVYSQAGQKVFATSIEHAGGSSSQTLKVRYLTAGNYKVEIVEGKTRWVKSITIQ